jgi:hypothetical protein
MTTKTADKVELKVSDRCDYCGAQAFVSASFLAGPLYLCGHHYAKWQKKIDATAYAVFDGRDRINVKPSQSSA